MDAHRLGQNIFAAALLTDDGDPFTYERYLYTCRWKNPRPEIPLRALRIRSLRPNERPTLAVLAVTLAE